MFLRLPPSKRLIAEYAARFSVCGERLKYRGARGKVRFVCSSHSSDSSVA